MSFLENKMCPP